MKQPHYLIRVGDALSQLLNVIFLNGDANESISGRAYRERWRRTERTINWALSWLEDDHCYAAYLSDLERARELVGSTDKIT